MQLPEYTQHVHDQLHAAAALGDDRTQQIAGGLAGAADAAVRLALVSAVSAAAEEITAALAEAEIPGSPSVRVTLDGDDLRLSVTTLPTTAQEPAGRADDGDATARISLRLSDALKGEIEQAAADSDVSINTWLVRAARSALAGPSRRTVWDDPWPPARGSHRITGWVTG
jgi:hypothetical protein